MRLGGWPYPVVVDLAGMRVTRKSRPILKDHDRGSIVGHTDDISVNDSRLEVAGVISGVGTTAQEVIATSENGFPWQASLGASADKVVFIAEGKSAKANGRDFEGPLYISRKSTLGEVSFVALGADDDTEARVAAGRVTDDETAEDDEIDDEELDPVTISGCGVSIAATFELYDGTIILVEAGIGRWVKAAFSDKVFDQSVLCRMQPGRQIACQFRRGSEPVFRPDPSRLEGCVVVIVGLGSDGSARGPGRIGGPVSQRNRTPASSAGDGVLSGLRSADALR